MLDLAKSDDNPIQLDDPLEAFRDFRSILLTQGSSYTLFYFLLICPPGRWNPV